MVAVDAALGSIGQHELDRGDVVGLEAALARLPADTTAERVADDADGGRGAVERGQPVLRGGVDHGLPPDAGPSPCDPVPRIDLDGVHLIRADQQRLAQIPLRACVVTATLDRDLKAGGAGGADQIRDLVRGARVRDRGRVLVDRQIETAARLVVGGITGHERGRKRVVHGRRVGGELGCHARHGRRGPVLRHCSSLAVGLPAVGALELLVDAPLVARPLRFAQA
jgi:hypothetical protein